MYRFLLFLAILIGSCSNNKNGKPNYTNGSNKCESDVYASILKRSIVEFKPTNLNLDSSIKSDRYLNCFLDTANKNCLKMQSNFKEFVATIIIKQYSYQLLEYHQGYDLLQMRTGNAKYIVEYFKQMTGVDSNIEMLNSGYVIDYLRMNPGVTNTSIERTQNEIRKYQVDILRK